MSAELPRPGVEVIQEFRSVTPTVVTPTLVPCIVGPAKQVVDLLVTGASGSSSLNTDALITLPAFFLAKAATGTPPVYTGLDGLDLVLAVNNGANVTVTFDDPLATGLSPATVVTQVNAALATAGITSVTAKTIGTTQWELRTVGVGEFQSIYIDATTSTVVAAAFGIGIGVTLYGVGNYNNYITQVPQAAFPDPRGNLEELAIESSSIRAFLYLGNSLGVREVSRTSAFCRKGVVDVAGVRTGNADITGLTYPFTGSLVVKVDGGASQTVTLTAVADAPAVLAAINAQTTGLVASLASITNYLVLTSDTTGYSSSIEVVSATAALGMAAGETKGVSIKAVDDGNGDATTSILEFDDGTTPDNFSAAPTAVTVDGSGGVFPLAGDSTLVISDGHQEQTLSFAASTALAAVITAINDAIGSAAGGYITASDNAGQLRFLHSKTGSDSVIHILGGSLVALGLTAGSYYSTAASKPEPGDELYIDGEYYATIVQVAPGGVTDRLKINKQVAISNEVGAYYYIVAKNLPGATGRPAPELTIGTNGDANIKDAILRDTTGALISTKAALYLSYSALRLDVTQAAAQPGLLRFTNTTEIDEAMEPLTAENPLALGAYFAALNAPGAEVTCLGVDETSADYPEGTLEAYTRAAEYLEAYEVYAIAPLTHEETVHQLFQVHVGAMSDSEAKGERIVLINPTMPTRERDTVVASGTNGNSGSPAATVFDTGVANLPGLLLAAGVNPIGTIPVDSGVYLDIASDNKKYSVQSVSGGSVTIRTSFAAGENDDAYYATTDLNDPPLDSLLISEAFAVKIRGDVLANNTDTAATIAALGQAYLDRRVWMVVPDKCVAPVGGISQTIDGYYMCAAIAGMIAQQPPQQSFTNFPMAGFTAVKGSNDTFTSKQLNVMAGGGAYIVVQDSQGAPLISRFALTTNTTSIETRTDSITKVVDFTAKFLRRGIKNFIGRFNVTQGLMDTLGAVLEGLLGFLKESGVLIGASINNIIQDDDAPDTVLVDVTLDVPYPCNFIRLTLVV